MTTSLYYSYKELPASMIAEEQFTKAKEVFELTVQAIKANLKAAEDKFKEERTISRTSAQWEYSMTESTVNESGKHYHIHRKAVNPQVGDTEFYKDINYYSFKIVNNVFISTGSGHTFQQINTGDIVTTEEIEQLDNLIVPEKFKNKPIIKEEGIWVSGS